MNFSPADLKGENKFSQPCTPPYIFAGKYLTILRPAFRAAIISVGVTQPGVIVILLSIHQCTITGSNPGETMNFAPASIDSLHFSRAVSYTHLRAHETDSYL